MPRQILEGANPPYISNQQHLHFGKALAFNLFIHLINSFAATLHYL